MDEERWAVKERRIDWEEAEALFTDLRSDWLELNRDGSYGYRYGPHLLHPTDITLSPVELWLMEPEVRPHFLEVRADSSVLYPCDDGELIEWEIRPYWRRSSPGNWNCPLPLPRCLTEWRSMMSGYRFSDDFSEEEYSADAGRVVAHAKRYGQAKVVRPDGSVRVVISIPTADLPEVVPKERAPFWRCSRRLEIEEQERGTVETEEEEAAFERLVGYAVFETIPAQDGCGWHEGCGLTLETFGRIAVRRGFRLDSPDQGRRRTRTGT